MTDAMVKKRMEKDLQELQTLISKHFEQRKVDDKELDELETRIQERKEERARQIQIRHDREVARMKREKEERAAKEAEELLRKQEEEERKKKAIQDLSANHGGYQNQRRKGGRQTEREKKKKILAERRKALNIDHLKPDALKDKCKELDNFLNQLQEERYDFECRLERQKYDIKMLRMRCQQFMTDKKLNVNKKEIKTISNMKAKAAAFGK